MRKQHRTVIEFADKIFGPPAQFFKGPPLQAPIEIFRDGNSEIVAPHLDPL